uniref:Head maturation protease n=1 Tax=Decurrovirus sp. TaxID=2832697 RepID=A0AAU8HXI6_9CAUD
MSDLQTRDFKITPAPADTDDAPRTVRGLAVPYNTEIELIPGYFETIAPGALAPRADTDTSLKLVYRHDEPIGLITAATETDAGIEIEARFSDTQTARDAYQLVRDGVIDRLSIGFAPLETTRTEDERGTHTTITSLALREVSLVPFPAYQTAAITEVRNQPTNHPERNTPMSDTPEYALAADLADLRADVTAMEQRASLAAVTPETRAADTRTPGEALKALASDEAYRAAIADMHARAFNGTKSGSDATMVVPEWVKDLTRLADKPNVLAHLFSTGSLPADGLELDFTELATNTLRVDEMLDEGENLPLGKITTSKRSAPIRTFGGYTELTLQAIQRARVNLLDISLRGMAIAAGQAAATYFAAQLAAAVKTQDAKKLAVSKAATSLNWQDISGLFIDAAARYADLGLSLDGLVVDLPTFKALSGLTGTDGRPLMRANENPANTIGTVDARALTGVILDVPVTCNLRATPGQLGTGIVGSFYNREAMRTYETPLVQLQDENVINLTKQFSVYRYGAVAAEIPTGLVPLKIGA